MRFLLALFLSLPVASGGGAGEPARIAADGISMQVPDGWRQLGAAEVGGLSTDLKPQTPLQQRLVEKHAKPDAPLIMKHDVAGATMAASVQASRRPMTGTLAGASSLELARVLATSTKAAFPGTMEVEPREITLSGLPAAEFGQRYTLVDAAGSHDMRSHMLLVSRGTFFYLIGYAGPANDAADADVFTNVVIKSLKLAPK